MKHPSEKGQFSTDIAQDVLDEALKAVEKHSTKSEGQAAPQSSPSSAAAASGPAAPAVPSAEVETLKAELEVSMAKGRELMGKLKDEHEKMLRAVADLDNYKKRALKEKEEVQRFGIEKLLKDFLPVVDNCDRALEAAKSPADFASLRTGVEMIRRLFDDTLGKHGVKSFTAKGQVFDPTKHEAMTAAETSEMPPNHVFAEVLRGYLLNDRLVRPALVVVSRAPTAPPAAEPAVDAAPPPGDSGEGPKQP